MLLPGFENPILRDWIDDLIGTVTGGSPAPAPTPTATPKPTAAPSSGGGGSVPAPVNTNTTGAWSIREMEDGSVVRVNELTGEVQVVIPAPSRPADPYDVNQDGYDDRSGYPRQNGTSAVSMGGKLYFQGQEINPDGSLKTAAPAGAEQPDLVNVGGKPYVWDPVTRQFVPAPGIANVAGSSGNNTGGPISFTPPRSSGGGGGSSASSRDYLGEIAAKSGADQDYLAKKFQFEKEMALLEFQLRNDPNNPELLLRRQQLMHQEKMDHAAQQSRDIDSFRSAVSDVDPAAARAWQFANGLSAGGNIANRLTEGGNALSDQANAGAAALLAKIRSPFQSVYQQMAGLPGVPGGTPAPGTPAPTGQPSGGLPGLPAEPQRTSYNDPANVATAASNHARRQAEWFAQNDAAEAAKFEAYRNPANWVQDAGGYMRNTVTGDSLSMQAYAQNRANEWASDSNNMAQFWSGASAEAGTGGMNASSGNAYFSPITDVLGQKMGTSYNQVSDQLPGFVGYGAQPAMNLADDNIQREIPGVPGATGPAVTEPSGPHMASGGSYTQGPDGKWYAVGGGAAGGAPGGVTLPGLAKGGVAQGLMVVGEQGPEVVNAPMGATVTPISRPMMHGLLGNGVPGYAWGTPYSSSPWGSTQTPYVAPQPAYTPPATAPIPAATPAGSGTTTSPVPAATPSPQVSPVSQPSASPPPATAPATVATATPVQPTTVQTPTASGDLVTTDPATAEQIEEIRQWRLGQLDPMFAETGPYSLAFQDRGPNFQEGFFRNYQTARGVPAADFAHEVDKWRMRGLSRESLMAGSGR